MTRYDPVADLYFGACGVNSRMPPVMNIFNGKDGKFIASVPVNATGRKVAYDETNKMVYTIDLTPFQPALVGFPWPAK
jgi:hypothetical protein